MMKKLVFPNRITIELTNRCNVSCTFCPRQCVNMPIGDMEADLYYKIIDEASDHLPVTLVFFFRGESLLHPLFMDFLRYARKKGLGPIQFASNAYAMTEAVADQLLDAEIDFISFSLDTLNAELYAKTRQEGDLKKSMDHVVYLCNKIKKQREQGGGVTPVTQVSTIETSEYIDGQKEFVDFWTRYVDIVRVYYEHDDNGKFRNRHVQQQLEQEIPERMPCRKVFTDMLIYWDGTLALCNYDWRGGISGINVKEQSLQEAWDAAEYENIRQMQYNNNYPDGMICKNCQHWRIDYMKGGFLGKAFRGHDEIQ